jgi:hypothetical protein
MRADIEEYEDGVAYTSSRALIAISRLSYDVLSSAYTYKRAKKKKKERREMQEGREGRREGEQCQDYQDTYIVEYGREGGRESSVRTHRGRTYTDVLTKCAK